ncbi:hypothetical protein SAMN05444166_0228 [Singulisphaera sp. GP187]|nr:hypothetical protein SAMN05444166_0228 [Singulisphaera sp. GP187]
MPIATVNISDVALASSTPGSLPVSRGPGAIPLYDPSLSYRNGCLTSTVSSGYQAARKIVHPDSPSVWTETWAPTVFAGSPIPDCVRVGSSPATTAPANPR